MPRVSDVRLPWLTRSVLRLLARSATLDANIRHFIADWLVGFEQCEQAYVGGEYGLAGLLVVDAITEEIAANMAVAFAEATERSTLKSFALWSEQFTNDE